MYPASCRTDLHTHSRASDGRLSPAELVEQARAAGVELLALTDHDTTDGLDEARQAADAAGIALINGVEISVSWEGKTLHIVGLNIDPRCPKLCAGLAGLQALREDRARRIAAKLASLGVNQPMERAAELAQGGQITRTHFARLLVSDGLVADLKLAFRRHLAAGKPAYVATQWAALDEAIGWIHAAGGLAVLAHPLRYRLSGAWRQRMLTAFKAAGGDALEVSAGASQQAQDLALCTRDALNHGLLASVGSDFHGPEQRWLKLGRLAPLSSQLTPVWTRLDRSCAH